MRGSFAGRAALGAAVLAAAQAAQAGTITGTATYDGKVPALKPLSVAAEPICSKQHETVPNEMLVLGSGNTMANVLVRVVSGLPAGKTYPAPTTPVTMDQHGCQYKPHVMGIMVGQPFKVLNSDGILHNVHALPKVNATFNMAMPPTRKEASADLRQGRGHVRDQVRRAPLDAVLHGRLLPPVLRGDRRGRQVLDRRTCPRAPTRSRPGTRSSARRRRR